MANKINLKEAVAESKESGTELTYNTYGMPGVVFVTSTGKGGKETRCGWFSAGYVKKVRRLAGLAPQFKDSKSQNA